MINNIHALEAGVEGPDWEGEGGWASEAQYFNDWYADLQYNAPKRDTNFKYMFKQQWLYHTGNVQYNNRWIESIIREILQYV